MYASPSLCYLQTHACTTTHYTPGPTPRESSDCTSSRSRSSDFWKRIRGANGSRPPISRLSSITWDHRRPTEPPQESNNQVRGAPCVDLRRISCGQDIPVHFSGKRPSEGVARARLHLQARPPKNLGRRISGVSTAPRRHGSGGTPYHPPMSLPARPSPSRPSPDLLGTEASRCTRASQHGGHGRIRQWRPTGQTNGYRHDKDRQY